MNEQSRQQFKMIVVATENGLPLVSVKLDKNLKEEYLTPFFSSIHQYSDLGGLQSHQTNVIINDYEIVINRKDGLMLIGVFDKDMKKLSIMQDNMYKVLTLFKKMYQEELEAIQENKPVDMKIFKKFEFLIENAMQTYIQQLKEDEENRDKGIFTKLISLFKKKPE
ncbi:MAG: hypothetical protein K9W44_15445 [Candidatus Lokiarchaeota archaeon]|nr:hypothetical protein [Candidatus Harpocratesius repetitus]